MRIGVLFGLFGLKAPSHNDDNKPVWPTWTVHLFSANADKNVDKNVDKNADKNKLVWPT
jgi:hypothetical protein